MREAQGVAHLVRRQLAKPRDGDLHRIVGAALALLVGAHQALEDQHVLAHPKGAQQHRALDDLAGARVGDRLAVGPAAGGAVHPVDDVVADVQGVGALRHDLHAIGVLEAGGLEGLGPPAGALLQGRADRLRRGAVHVVDDGLLDGGDRLGRVGLLQSEAMRQAHGDVLVQRRGIVIDDGIEAPRARIEDPRDVARLRQLDQAVAHGERDQLGVRGDVAHLGARGVGGEGLAGLELQVQGEHLHRGGIGHRQVGHLFEALLAGPLQVAGDVLHVAGQEAGEVHKHAAVGHHSLDLAGPDGGDGEGVVGGGLFVGGGAGRPEARVLVLGDHLLAEAAEHQDLAAPDPRPVEPDRRRAKPGLERGDIEKAAIHAGCVGGGQGHENAALVLVDIDGDQAILPSQAGDGIDRRLGRVDRLGRRARENHRQGGRGAQHLLSQATAPRYPPNSRRKAREEPSRRLT